MSTQEQSPKKQIARKSPQKQLSGATTKEFSRSKVRNLFKKAKRLNLPPSAVFAAEMAKGNAVAQFEKGLKFLENFDRTGLNEEEIEKIETTFETGKVRVNNVLRNIGKIAIMQPRRGHMGTN